MSHRFLDLVVYFSKRAPFLLGRKGVDMACGLIVFAVLARKLSVPDFAVYSLALSVVGIARASSLPGIGNALSQCFARGHTGDFGRATILSLATSLLGSLGLGIGAWLHLKAGDDAMAQALMATAIGFPLHAGLQYWRNTFVGSDLFGHLMVLDSLSSVIRTGAVIACVFLYPDQLFPLVLAAMLGPAVVNVGATIWQWIRLPRGGEREPGALKYGALVSLYELPALVVEQVDRLVLFYFVSPEALAIYMAALRIPVLMRSVTAEAIAALSPLFATQSNYTGSLHQFSVRLSLAILAGSLFAALAIVPWLLPLLAGPKYEGAVIYAQILTAGVAAGTLGQIYFRFVKSQLNSRLYLHITLAQAAVDIHTVLILTYFFGMEGAVAAFILKGVVNSMLTGVLVRRRYSVTEPEGS